MRQRVCTTGALAMMLNRLLDIVRALYCTGDGCVLDASKTWPGAARVALAMMSRPSCRRPSDVLHPRTTMIVARWRGRIFAGGRSLNRLPEPEFCLAWPAPALCPLYAPLRGGRMTRWHVSRGFHPEHPLAFTRERWLKLSLVKVAARRAALLQNTSIARRALQLVHLFPSLTFQLGWAVRALTTLTTLSRALHIRPRAAVTARSFEQDVRSPGID